MKQQENKQLRSTKRLTLKLCFGAVFAALVCACTFISVPLPFGYFNLGDIMLLLGAWSVGPWIGAAAAAIGAGLADLLMGYTVYVPATAVIKAAMAIVAYFICRMLRKPLKPTLARIISAVCAETVMVLGYFAYEFFCLYGMGAVSSILGNLLQGACAVVGGVILGGVFERTVGRKYGTH